MNHQYRLMLNEAQIDTLLRALDLYARVGCGQFEEIARLFRLDSRCGKNVDIVEIDRLFGVIKQCLFPSHHGGSYSICSREVPVDYQLAWDMFQVVWHHVSWEKHPEGGNTVNFDRPMNTSGRAFCTVETVAPMES